MQKDKLTVYIFASTSTSAKTLRHKLTPLAKKFAKYVIFGVADAVEYAPMAQNFGLMVEKGFPALVVHAPVNDNVFVYQQGRKIERGSVEAMLTTVLQGKATSNQVFGSEAGVMEAQNREESHDEL
jgi:protein disulfide-isomerase A1